MKMSQADHFVGVLVVHEVNFLDPNNERTTAPKVAKIRLDPVEKAKIVVTANTMESLKEKLAAHVELLSGD